MSGTRLEVTVTSKVTVTLLRGFGSQPRNSCHKRKALVPGTRAKDSLSLPRYHPD